ncbi:MAG: hypothetical protein M0T73_10665 [Deltaproteobacteria bacterium]|nr:hypothetical protein [Deltaproteobacteria bacterium]
MTSRVITANIDDGPKDLASLFAKYRFRGIPAFTLACAATLFKAGINVEEASQAALAHGTAGLEISHMSFCLWPVQRVGIRHCDPASVDDLNNI